MEISLIIAEIMATYAITSVLVYSGGAYGRLEAFRQKLSVKRFGLLECFLCTSFWVGLIAVWCIGGSWNQFFIVWGVTFILDQIIQAYRTK